MYIRIIVLKYVLATSTKHVWSHHLSDNGAPNISLQKRFSSTAMPSILSPSDVMQKGLGYIGIGQEQQAKMSLKVKVEDFKAHYGSSPLVIADIWHDLCHTGHLLCQETSLR
jgi:hypothetical protein